MSYVMQMHRQSYNAKSYPFTSFLCIRQVMHEPYVMPVTIIVSQGLQIHVSTSFLRYCICMFNHRYHNQHLSISTVYIPRIHTICTTSRIHITYTYLTYSYRIYILHVFISRILILCIHNMCT